MKQELSKSVIDTSKMSSGERAALEVTEAARQSQFDDRSSFAAGFFMGRPDFARVTPFPEQSVEDRDQGDAFLSRLWRVLSETDPDEIDASGEIPDETIAALAAIGAFGIKIPHRYGGLGLSQTNYTRAAMMLGGFDANLTALLSAHQSIGVPQPLIAFGTEEQKRRFLPRCAGGEISAFALTESDVGSDPARMRTTATPTDDGEGYILRGEKLWCTNVIRAGLLVVMANVPGKGITAFIVEADSPGVEIVRRCRFMGLRALYNGVVHFDRVRVPRKNVILGEGRGLKVALATLNTGRITLPAGCTGAAKRCLEITHRWANGREQWGNPIGRHAAVAEKIARMEADTYAMESMTLLVSAMVDADKSADIRIEAAMAKLWGTERTWRIVDDTMQIRGGRGYETAASLRARGEAPEPVERFMRDARINTIFEGSSEIMRLFIAREALDPHLKIGAPVLNSTLSKRTRLQAALRAGMFYARWYPLQWVPRPFGKTRALRLVDRLSRRLARSLFHSMLRYGPKLDKQQVLLGRYVDIATELFAITAVNTRGDKPELAKLFTESSKLRIEELFRAIRQNTDAHGYRVAQRFLKSPASEIHLG
ncbi:MAG: acyl-CoA dehydrogenase family protein [Verrucomicrobiales bacterium]